MTAREENRRCHPKNKGSRLMDRLVERLEPMRENVNVYPSVKDHGTHSSSHPSTGEWPAPVSGENRVLLKIRESKGGVRVSDPNCFRAFFCPIIESLLCDIRCLG